MAVKFTNGTPVKQVLPAPIEGTVVRFQFDENSGNILYIVEDADGVERSFKEDDLEAV